MTRLISGVFIGAVLTFGVQYLINGLTALPFVTYADGAWWNCARMLYRDGYVHKGFVLPKTHCKRVNK